MKIASWTLTLALMLLAGGCAAPPMRTMDAAPCNHGVCKAEVSVWNCSKGYITVKDDPIEIPNSQSLPKNIEWTIVTDDYKFVADGIVVDPGSRGFSGGHVTGNGKKFTLHDGGDLGIHKYTVKVMRESDGTPCMPKDPYILNR